MVSKIHARRVMKMGREPRHSLMVTIPRKICKSLQIGKGTVLYFKLEENCFIVSQDLKLLENNSQYVKTDISVESKKEGENVITGGISLADLQY